VSGSIADDRTRDASGRLLPTDRQFADWLIFFAVSIVATCGMILTNSSDSPARGIVASILVFALAPLYWFSARPSLAGMHRNRSRAWSYAILATIIFLIAVALNPWASIALFVLSPQMFLLLTFVPAAASIVTLNAGMLIIQLVTGAGSGGSIWQSIAVTAGVIILSIFFSNRLTSVTYESEARGELIAELRSRQADIAALSEQQGISMERERIAREMHDTLAQGFTSIVMLGHAVAGELERDPDAARRHVELITRTAQENLHESRRLIAALSPAHLDGSSLVQAVERIGARLEDESGLGVSVSVTGEPEPAAPALEVVALRVCQEAMANIRKHADARAVRVTLDYTPELLRISVIDDGRGFDPAASRTGYGLDGMRSRLHDIGGALEVRSSPGNGTTVTARLPMSTGAGE
jgi:signal transduction histidine kinase